MIVLSRAQVRALDRLAVERYGIPSLVLMENAGRGATDFLLRSFPPSPPSPYLVVAGRGNNGGDGFVVARHLALRGMPVEVAILGEHAEFRGGGDAGVNFSILERMGVAVHPIRRAADLTPLLEACHVVVDAILGTGLTGEVRGLVREAIEAVNASGRPVLALDVPSGLDADGGHPLGAAVRAAATVTFAALKRGLVAADAAAYTGPVTVTDIGAPVVMA